MNKPLIFTSTGFGEISYLSHNKWYNQHLKCINIWEIKEFNEVVNYVTQDLRQNYKVFLTGTNQKLPELKRLVKRNLNIKRNLNVDDVELGECHIVGISYMRGLVLGKEMDHVVKLFEKGYVDYKKTWDEKRKPKNIKEMEELLDKLKGITYNSGMKGGDNIIFSLFRMTIEEFLKGKS